MIDEGKKDKRKGGGEEDRYGKKWNGLGLRVGKRRKKNPEIRMIEKCE